MSTPVQTRPRAHERENNSLRPEAQLAVQRMQDAMTHWLGESHCTLTENGVEIPAYYGNCSLNVTPVGLDTVDGLRISERLEARTVLNDAFNQMEDNFLSLANAYATTGATIRCPEIGKVVVVSSIQVFRRDVDALYDLYTPMIIWSGAVQAFSVQQALRQWHGSDCIGDSSNAGWLDHYDEPSHWGAEDFDYAQHLLDAGGVYCNASETGLTAEFPWEPDAVSAMVGDQTSLLQFDNQVEHSTAGNGLAFRLVLPVSASDEELLELADVLNRTEIEGVDVPPCFGGWCLLEQIHSVAYAGFWPNGMYQRGTVANIAAWCQHRHRIARQLVGNRH